MSNTLLQITNAVYSGMHIPSDSTIFDRSTKVIPLINTVIDEICVGSLNNMLVPTAGFQSPVLRFLSKQAFFKTIPSVGLDSAINIGDTTINFASTNFASSGAILINGNIIPYTGNTSTSITGCTNVLRAQEAGQEVQQVFALPTDFAKPFELWNADENTQVPFLDDRDPKFGIYWTIKNGTGTTGDFLYIEQEDATFRLDYVANPNVLVNDNDATDIPDQYGINMIAPIVGGMLLYGEYGDDPLGVRGKGLLSAGYSTLTSFYSKYAVKIKKHRQTVQRRPWGYRA